MRRAWVAVAGWTGIVVTAFLMVLLPTFIVIQLLMWVTR